MRNTTIGKENRGFSLMELGRLAEAEVELLAAARGLQVTFDRDHWRVQAALRDLVSVYERSNKGALAERYRSMLTPKRREADSGSAP